MRPGAPPPGAHLPREPSGGVGQRHDELGRRTRREEPFDGTDDADRPDRVPAMIEHRGGDLRLADHGLLVLGRVAGLARPPRARARARAGRRSSVR